MAKFDVKPKVKFEVVITLDEEEARALDALAGYETDAFLSVFYENMGRHFLETHADGLRHLFYTTRESLKPILNKIDNVQKTLNQ